MTIKLGAIEYEKWQNGYLKGHEDGRMGRPRSPTPTAAKPAAQSTEIKFEPSSRTRAAIRSAQAAHPGAPILAVYHDHGGASKHHCEGFLVVLKDRLILQGTEATDSQVHNFEVPYDQIQEVKKNSLTIFFHVNMKDGRNFNFLTSDEPVADAVAKILSVAPTLKK